MLVIGMYSGYERCRGMARGKLGRKVAILRQPFPFPCRTRGADPECGEVRLTTCKSAAGPRGGARTNLRSLWPHRRVPPTRSAGPPRPVSGICGLGGSDFDQAQPWAKDTAASPCTARPRRSRRLRSNPDLEGRTPTRMVPGAGSPAADWLRASGVCLALRGRQALPADPNSTPPQQPRSRCLPAPHNWHVKWASIAMAAKPPNDMRISCGPSSSRPHRQLFR